MVTKCPSKYTDADRDRRSSRRCPSSVGPRSLVTLGLVPLRARRGATPRPRAAARRLAALGAERAHRLVRHDARRGRRARSRRFLRHDFSLRRTSPSTRAARCRTGYKLSALLGRAGGVAAPLAPGPDGLRGARRAGSNRQRARDLVAWVAPVLGGVAVVLRVAARRASRARSPRRRRRPTAPGSTRACRTRTWWPTRRSSTSATSASTVPFAFAMGALLAGPHGRALDRRHPPLDARRLDGARRRPAARRALGVRRGRLGRLLRLGSGRERGADAVARRDRVPALGDDPGEARDAEGLERRRSSASRSASRCSGRSSRARASSTRSTRSRRARSAPGSSPSSSSSSSFSTAMIFCRLPLLRATTRLESLVSREATFLYNNLLLVALCLTILWGVAWPLLSEAVRGESVVVGRPVLRLLPPHLRAAAAAADGHRAAGRLAARVAARARRGRSPGRRASRSRPASCSSRSAPARRSRA